MRCRSGSTCYVDCAIIECQLRQLKYYGGAECHANMAHIASECDVWCHTEKASCHESAISTTKSMHCLGIFRSVAAKPTTDNTHCCCLLHALYAELCAEQRAEKVCGCETDHGHHELLLPLHALYAELCAEQRAAKARTRQCSIRLNEALRICLSK